MYAGPDRIGVRSVKKKMPGLIELELGRLNIDAVPDRTGVRSVQK